MSALALAERRRAQVAKAQLQRVVLQDAAADLRHNLAFAENAFAIVGKLRSKPVVTASIAAGLVALAVSPRRALKWISYAATAYSVIRRVSPRRDRTD
jgi:hypothetical protein